MLLLCIGARVGRFPSAAAVGARGGCRRIFNLKKKSMKKRLIYGTVLAGTLAACSGSAPDVIRLNQVGYFPGQEKVAVANVAGVTEFTVVNAATGQEVLKSATAMTENNPWTTEARSAMDFSVLNEPGSYLLLAGGDTAAFEIKERPLAAVADAALKSFYYQRSGMAIEEPYAGQWSRPAAHPDTEVLVHPSAAGPKRQAGDVISSPGGWYDAGDYNKYVVNSAYSIGLMQALYRLFPDYFAKQNVNIPESGNQTPDLLDEIYYNLNWLLTMQDMDGGVYHKLTTPNFEAFIKPTECKQQRYVVQKSVTATLDFAAVMAQASTIFKAFSKDYPGFAAKALRAAEQAYAWAQKNPEAYYDQNALNKEYDPDINTGEYGDRDASDELFWAASELYFATGKQAYLTQAVKSTPRRYTLPSWGNTSALGYYVWLMPGRKLKDGVEAGLGSSLRSYLLVYATNAVKGADKAAFHAPYGDEESDFFWGSLAEQCANQATTLVYAYLLDGKMNYLTNAYRNMDYLLGRNPLGYCYVTGLGRKSPLHPHHRLSATDGIEAPIPGFLVGGPNPGQEDKQMVTYPSPMPDESYVDDQNSYASNEIAINWSAGLVAASSALDALSMDK